MMRGFMYEVQKDSPDFQYHIKAAEYYSLAGYEAECFDDLDAEVAKEQVKAFVGMLSEICETGEEDGIAYFILDEESKEKYFKSMFLLFQNLSSEMTLEMFSKDSQAVSRLCRVLEDDYDDVVVVGGAFYTLDYFLRDAEIGVKYYIVPSVIEMG